MAYNKKCPTCAATECAACENGRCVTLIDNDFGKRKCPFFKTREQVAQDKAYRDQRLADLGLKKREG